MGEANISILSGLCLTSDRTTLWAGKVGVNEKSYDCLKRRKCADLYASAIQLCLRTILNSLRNKAWNSWQSTELFC